MEASLKDLEPEKLRVLLESENFCRPNTLYQHSPKDSDEYKKNLGAWVAAFKSFCHQTHIPDVEKPRCPKCSQITWQVGRSLTAVVCGHCSVAYCMHCCFEQVESPFQTEDLAGMRAHLPQCQSNKFPSRCDSEAFLHPEIFQLEMARFTLAFLNTQVFRLTRPGVGVLGSVMQDETWLDAVREGMLISMPHQPHSALPSMVAIFVSHVDTALTLISRGVWESCNMVVGIMPVEQLMPDEIERLPKVPAAGADGEEEKKANAGGAGDEAQAVVATAVAEA